MATALPIFVSHSHEDKAFCQSLVMALRNAGADVWYDEHNMESGNLMDVIMRELDRRKIFIVILSKNAFASRWVRKETGWAYELAERDPTRVILPVTAAPIERSDFGGANGWLFLHDYKRIEAPGFQPFPLAETIGRVLHALALTPAGEAPAPTAPQPTESVDDLITRGKALSEQGKHVEALALFERATQIDANSYLAWFNVGFSLNELRRYEQALVAYNRAISLNKSDVAVWNNKGSVLNSLQRYPEALAAYEQALALDSKMKEAWNGKGNALYGLQRYSEALAAFEQALALDSKFALAWNGKGNALWGLKQYADGLVAYRQALAIDPNYALAWSNMAMTLRLLGRDKEAEEAEARAKALGG